jgi:hypothetical protein
MLADALSDENIYVAAFPRMEEFGSWNGRKARFPTGWPHLIDKNLR